MHYYTFSILGSPLEPLTFSSLDPYPLLDILLLPFQKKEKDAVVLEEVDKPEFKTVDIIEAKNLSFSKTQYKFAKFISEYYFCSLGEAFSLFVPFDKDINTVKIEELKTSNIELSSAQDKALKELQKHKVSLLFGDTGSGKTEIYMKWFEEVLAQDKSVLMLMPEISLTPQMQDRLEEHFGDKVVMWHSKLTKKQKEKALKMIHNGSARVIAGARSSLFLPIKDLGFIAVDEEHDDSYKASSRPRYNARDMAIYYASLLKIPVLLGSATPSLSSYVKFPYVRLKGGYFNQNRRFVYEPHVEEITPIIEEAVTKIHAKKEQSMLFLPTRANFKYMICDRCSYTYKCPYCDVGMSVHKFSRRVKCHYCNFSEPIPEICPECKTGNLLSSRLGTAEAVEYFEEKYPDLRVGQFDRDKITTQKKLKALLSSFNEGEIDLLIGTQMLSKGHDYHDVTLAVILGIDNILQMSDYRAREKALSLLIQIAGRSGRKKDAIVLVQSFYQEFFSPYILKYEEFLDDEKEFRKELYPPYKKLSKLSFAHIKKDKANDNMNEVLQKLYYAPNIEVVGHGPSPIEKIANKFRFQILLRSDKSTDLIKAIKMSKNILCEVDMDPIDFV
ncbi:MAG TPA: primosomal protein N' [Sulfurimonas sp.]|nr:primosomal protein N' [Sulfurimonas sp.]